MLTFNQIANIAHQVFGVIVFSMEIEPKNASGQHRSVIRLNPSKFELCDWEIFNFYLYIICGDEVTAKRVQKLEMPDSKYLRMIGVPRIHKTKAN